MDVVETTQNEADAQNAELAEANNEQNEKMFPHSYVEKLRKEGEKKKNAISELSAKLAEIENAKLEAEKNALIEQGKFKELFEKEQAEKQRLIDELERVKPYEQKHLDFINQKKESLLSNLPEDIRDTFKDLDVDKLETLSAKFINDTGKPQGVPNSNTPKPTNERNDYKSPFMILT